MERGHAGLEKEASTCTGTERVFAAGVANAAVTDWAHYQDLWTSPHPESAARGPRSVPAIEPHRDSLLIAHGLIDDNVRFQDAARLIQKLIELEKPFEVMIYPTERHTIETEASRYDYNRRVVDSSTRTSVVPVTLPWNGFKIGKSSSPVTIVLAFPFTASARNLPSSGSLRA
jgi:hypothetical protein